MTVDNQTLYRLRHLPVVSRGVSLLQSLSRSALDLVGEVQLLAGQQPSIIGTSRVALKQWNHVLHKLAQPQKGTVLFAALRNRRWIEWSVFSACYLLRMGYQPILIFSSSRIEEGGKELASFWRGVSDIPFLRLEDLDKHLPNLEKVTAYDDFAHEAAHTVAAYNLEVEEHEGDGLGGIYEKSVAEAQVMLRRYAVAVEHALQGLPAGRLVCPSGLIGETLAVAEVTRRLGIESFYVEAWALRPGHLIWNLNRPALEYDIEGWIAALGTEALSEQDAQDFMAFRERQRVKRDDWLGDFHQVQRAPRGRALPKDLEIFLKRARPRILLGTNVVGDSSTLRRATIFRSQKDWIEQVVRFVKDREDVDLLVRAHPDELWVDARIRMGDVARSAARGAANVYVVGSEQKVNTYDLVTESAVGTAWVSNIGLDMALRGKPVVMAARPKYTGLRVVHEPSTREEYFERLREMLRHPVPPNPEALRLGHLYHQIVFKHLSLEADSRRYRTVDYRLGDPHEPPGRRTFYRILAGELGDKGLPHSCAASTTSPE